MEKSSILQSSIGCHQYPTPTDYSAALHGRSRVQSQSGLANPNNNCWLNAVLHVVCGTFIYDMISELLESKDIVKRCLNEVHKYLTKNKDSRRRETCLPNAAIQLTEMLNLNIEERQHEDVCDFYDKLLGYVSEKSKQMQPNPLDSQYLNLRTCQQCLHHEGEIASHNYISVKALNTQEEVSLTSLLWEKCTGQYSTTKEMRECGNCKSRNETSPGYHELTFIQKCPVIFSVLINRTDKDMSRVCSSPVQVPHMIDLSKLSVQYDKKRFASTSSLLLLTSLPDQ